MKARERGGGREREDVLHLVREREFIVMDVCVLMNKSPRDVLFRNNNRERNGDRQTNN